MRPIIRCFIMFIRQISKDSMLIVVCIAPLLSALFFRFGIPYAENLLCSYFNQQTILSNYYLLFDLLLSILTPYMLCFASAMVMLTEYDENMTSYLSITPIGKNGYLISRLLIPALIAFLFSVTLLLLFSLTVWNILLVIIICLINCFISVIISLLVFSYSSNKVEGMAMAKMAGLVMIGLPVPYFLKSVHQYVFCLLPSFWVAKLCVDSNYIFVIPVIITCLLWFVILYKKFIKKLR